MKGRRVARELALLCLSQAGSKPEKYSMMELQDMALAAVRTLTSEAESVLETAAAELKRGESRLLDSETIAVDLQSARVMVEEAISLTQKAMNNLGTAVEMPEFLQLVNQKEVRAFALEILGAVKKQRSQIDASLENALEDWTLDRLARIDRDLLRIAVAEIEYLGIPPQVAIDEAIEIAKRYGEEGGHRFINGVLRRVTARSHSTSST